ncbi:MAG: N-acetyltransferase family protein [Acidimicrobiales bacterium]|jgi:GNAT superfamily N-acetyltransferase
MERARPARDDDTPVCRELLAGALRELRSARGGEALAGNANGDELLERWMAARPRGSTVYVGEFDDAVVGLAVASASGSSGRIECCYVEEGARGVGVGTALMESMVAWCEERGCRDIDALALPGDRLTKQRLEAAGFSARLLVLNRPLS